jgi:hypothetical protein
MMGFVKADPVMFLISLRTCIACVLELVRQRID